MSGSIQTIAALVAIGAAVIGLGSWCWAKRLPIRNWWSRQMAAADDLEQATEAEQLETLRGQVADRARALGILLAERSVGNRVINTDGQTITYIRDFAAYTNGMNDGTVDRRRTWPGSPPIALDQRDRSWLEQWLNDHPLDDG